MTRHLGNKVSTQCLPGTFGPTLIVTYNNTFYGVKSEKPKEKTNNSSYKMQVNENERNL